MDNRNENIKPHNFEINQHLRSKKLNQIPKLIWFTGLSGSGKSTLSNALEKYLFNLGFSTYSLDGDNVRTGINSNLSFSNDDRSENIRRIAEISKLFLDAGLILTASFISPLLKDREIVRKIVGKKNFIEIYVKTPLEICEKRDVKGLYAMARLGQIPNFTGISSPYQAPLSPDVEIDTTKLSVEESIKYILKLIKPKLK